MKRRLRTLNRYRGARYKPGHKARKPGTPRSKNTRPAGRRRRERLAPPKMARWVPGVRPEGRPGPNGMPNAEPADPWAVR